MEARPASNAKWRKVEELEAKCVVWGGEMLGEERCKNGWSREPVV